MPKERSIEENVLIMRNMIRLLENWDSDKSAEENEAMMLPVMREIRAEFLEREAMKGVQDLSLMTPAN
jgi:hypothetical protein